MGRVKDHYFDEITAKDEVNDPDPIEYELNCLKDLLSRVDQDPSVLALITQQQIDILASEVKAAKAVIKIREALNHVEF